jgi:hypothetical protein
VGAVGAVRAAAPATQLQRLDGVLDGGGVIGPGGGVDDRAWNAIAEA